VVEEGILERSAIQLNDWAVEMETMRFGRHGDVHSHHAVLSGYFFFSFSFFTFL
jgi:hypothetical protein